MITTEQAWNILLERYGVSEQTLRVVTDIDGYSLRTLEDVLFVVAGERSFEEKEESDE